MKINNAEFVISAVRKQQYPNDPLPEIALAGRSNVGKSSFINQMIRKKKLARTSSTPGKTQTLNFYKINRQFYFVDVPGYGYAKVSKKEKERWGAMMEEYFQTRKSLQTVLLVTDLRHPPTKDDLQMFVYLQHFQIPIAVIATKYDKVKKKDQHKCIRQTENAFHVKQGIDLIPFSSQTGEGRDEVWSLLKAYL